MVQYRLEDPVDKQLPCEAYQAVNAASQPSFPDDDDDSSERETEVDRLHFERFLEERAYLTARSTRLTHEYMMRRALMAAEPNAQLNRMEEVTVIASETEAPAEHYESSEDTDDEENDEGEEEDDEEDDEEDGEDEETDESDSSTLEVDVNVQQIQQSPFNESPNNLCTHCFHMRPEPYLIYSDDSNESG